MIVLSFFIRNKEPLKLKRLDKEIPSLDVPLLFYTERVSSTISSFGKEIGEKRLAGNK